MSFWSTKIRIPRVTILFLLLSVLLIGGLVFCERVTRPVFYQLKPGMTMDEVRSIMGAPRAEFQDPRHTEWFYVFNKSRGRSTLHLYFEQQRLTTTGEKGDFWQDPVGARIIDMLEK